MTNAIARNFGQWEVTNYGVESIKGSYGSGRYSIPKNRLGEDWTEHMAEKDWVDITSFIRAIHYARKLWGIERENL